MEVNTGARVGVNKVARVDAIRGTRVEVPAEHVGVEVV